MGYDFRGIATDATSLSELMAGRTKLDTRDIMEQYPDGITITAADMVEYEKNGEPVEYPVLLFAENENAFYTGGIVLKKIVRAWGAPFDGDYGKMSEELAKGGGVKIKLSSGKSKNGNTITNIDIL